jgi:hypothetical protein
MARNIGVVTKIKEQVTARIIREYLCKDLWLSFIKNLLRLKSSVSCGFYCWQILIY